ncbi:MAG: TIGR03032 family protein [Proteobacteria bacterium]|nr:TIGR03032 family protein [Pseudomonadota bacterium]
MINAATKIPSASSTEPKETSVGYVHTSNFPELLRSLNLSLLVSTYQAQRILAFSPRPEKLFMLMRIFDRPTGIALDGTKLALSAKNKIWLFANTGELRDLDGKVQPHDICFAPRKAYVTGDIAAHEMAFIKGTLQIVNTRFSCICTVDDNNSFIPGWRPRFVTDLVAEDRCHLNGMATDSNGIRYVSALGETNVKEGWRPTKADGGIIIDFHSGEVITRGLAMPHSPRLHGGHLWILNSGCGELEVVDQKSGKRQSIIRLPGFLRGIDFHGNLAFIGLCKIREKKTFGNLPIETMFPELECGIYAVNVQTGSVVGFIKFTKGVEELFDVKILPQFTNPEIVGFEEETVDGLFMLPESAPTKTK